MLNNKHLQAMTYAPKEHVGLDLGALKSIW